MAVAGLTPHILGCAVPAKTNPSGQSRASGWQPVAAQLPLAGCTMDAEHMVILKHIMPFLGIGINLNATCFQSECT